ncbi:MAG: serine/threonine-protein phosphatase [Corynebacteriales bacterium]|nr:serine/threonine-protein phosphatase [Mycobacteriales bacterium]
MSGTMGPAAITPTPRAGVVAACVFAIFIAGLDLVQNPAQELAGLLVAAPFIACVFAPYRHVLAVGAFATVLATVPGMFDEDTTSARQLILLIAMVGCTLLAALISTLRERADAQVASLSRLADVAQQAVLRPVGPQIGNLSVAVRYVSASANADIGGDLYEAVDTPYGVRILIGDVRGKGLDAVRLASAVLGSYRHVAYERADLRAIVSDLDRAVARSVETEDFVTMCLIEERGGTLTVLNCGHPAPLLLRGGKVIALEPATTAPPLGFMPTATARTERLEPGDRVLLYTDGLTEARRAGQFFPLKGRAWRILGHGTVADGLLSLENALGTWVDGNLDDDIALVLLEYTGGAVEPASEPRPAWEWMATKRVGS